MGGLGTGKPAGESGLTFSPYLVIRYICKIYPYCIHGVYMSTTIRVTEQTHEILKDLRDKENLESYERLIEELLIRSGVLSQFGKDSDLPKWKESDRPTFRDE